MERWVGCLIVALAVLAAVLLLCFLGYMYHWSRGFGIYSDKNLSSVIKDAYAETGKDSSQLDIQNIEEVQGEDESGQSIYDARIKLLGGENVGKVMDFRYFFQMTKTDDETKKLTVTNVVGAPANSPLGAK